MDDIGPWEKPAILGWMPETEIMTHESEPTLTLVRHNFGLWHLKMEVSSHGHFWRCFLTPLYIDFEPYNLVAMSWEYRLPHMETISHATVKRESSSKAAGQVCRKKRYIPTVISGHIFPRHLVSSLSETK